MVQPLVPRSILLGLGGPCLGDRLRPAGFESAESGLLMPVATSCWRCRCGRVRPGGEAPQRWVTRGNAGVGGQVWGTGEAEGPPICLRSDRSTAARHATLGQQILDIPVRQRIAQIPTNRHQDHIRWIPQPSEARPQCWYSDSDDPSTTPPDLALIDATAQLDGAGDVVVRFRR